MSCWPTRPLCGTVVTVHATYNAVIGVAWFMTGLKQSGPLFVAPALLVPCSTVCTDASCVSAPMSRVVNVLSFPSAINVHWGVRYSD